MSEQEQVQQQDPLDNPVINDVAKKFAVTAADIANYASTMKGKQLARVLSAAMEFPFNSKMPTFRSKSEEELFLMCVGIQHYKSMMSAAIQSSESLTKEIENEAAQAFAEELLTKTQASGGN
jgi:hypothetical protein